MTSNSCRKRPCSICRKWFMPDVRQKERQKTCSKECRKERHRRQCADWNKKNKVYFKNNYLAKKIEKAGEQQTARVSSKASLPRQQKPLLPIEIIGTEYGVKSAIIAQYLAAQIIRQLHRGPIGFP